MKIGTLQQELSEVLLLLIQVDKRFKDSVQCRITASEWGVMVRLR